MSADQILVAVWLLKACVVVGIACIVVGTVSHKLFGDKED